MANAYFDSTESRAKALVVSCYRWEWQHLLTLEGAKELTNLGFMVDYLEVSGFESNCIKDKIKGALKRSETLKTRLDLLKSIGIHVSHPRFIILQYKVKSTFRKVLPLTFRSTLLESRWNIIYPGLVELTNDINVNIDKNKRLIQKTLVRDFYFVRLLQMACVNLDSYDRVLIVNGRYPLNRAASEFFKSNSLNVSFIEFGANRQKFQIYTRSPHSMENRKQLFQEFFEQNSVDQNDVNLIGAKLFKNRRLFDEQANLSWTRKMSSESIPAISTTRKICSFFPTSEKEFAGVSDPPPEGHFKDQQHALDALIKELGEEWEIFIRRHPKAHESTGDPEASRWEVYKNFENVHLIDPDSEVDSYALAKRSDLVAHYSSFIGPELIASGHQHVITLGPTQWENLDPKRHLHSAAEIADYLKNYPSNIPSININRLGFYTSTFGTDFKLYYWDGSKEKWLRRK